MLLFSQEFYKKKSALRNGPSAALLSESVRRYVMGHLLRCYRDSATDTFPQYAPFSLILNALHQSHTDIPFEDAPKFSF